MFFRPAIALSGAFLRLKRQELSEVTQLFPRRKRLLLRGLRPRHGCTPLSDRFLSAPTFLRRVPAAFPLSLTISNRPRSNGHATRSLFRIPTFEAAALLPPPFSFRAHFLLPLSCRRASFPSVTGAQPRQLPFVHSSPDCVLRVFFCLPRVLSSLRQKRPSHGNASFPRRLVFPSLPCVCVPRLPSPAPHLLYIPRRKLRQHRYAFVPQHLHTQKARLLMQTGLCTAKNAD